MELVVRKRNLNMLVEEKLYEIKWHNHKDGEKKIGTFPSCNGLSYPHLTNLRYAVDHQ
jgi:hypothetical protein